MEVVWFDMFNSEQRAAVWRLGYLGGGLMCPPRIRTVIGYPFIFYSLLTSQG